MEFITEFTRSQIAALVLGYLKSEKCHKAFNEFLEESPFFKKNRQNIRKGKYFVTRVAGLCLVDLLEEYASIYAIVQGRLEASNYYSEVHTKGTLVDQILCLLDRDGEVIRNSTPFRFSRSPSPSTLSTKQGNLSKTSEVDTTPIDALPGNGVEDTDSHVKTPKKKGLRNRSTNLDKDEAFDVSEVLTQTLLENHELHEKIAETINIVRNTPEGSKTVLDEHISAGASKELDAIIKTVVQRTEEDPIYHKLIDEIIGTAPFDNPPTKKANTSCNTHNLEIKRNSEKIENQSTPTTTNRIEDHNDDAIRSIIEAAHSTDLPPPQNNETNKKDNGGEVYVFEGTLDSYLKTSGGTNSIPPNPLYINTGGLIVMPPETSSKQFYIVNNQPLINMNVSTVKGVISDNDIMSMPTIIVNDETSYANQIAPVPKNPPNKRNKAVKIAPKADKLESISLDNSTKKSKKIKSTVAVVTASQTTPSVITAPSPRASSHVRNLDFSTPPPIQKGLAEADKKTEGGSRTWDADLRSLIATNRVDKCPTPKRRRSIATRPKKKTVKTKNKFEEKLEEKKEEVVEPEKSEEPDTENPILATPVKDDALPKTPGGEVVTAKTPGGEVAVTANNNLPCTPFTEVLEEQLRGVDLISLPTPKIPITPGFAINLTPADVPPYNRSTDYSTSSSYYQPSDTEQNKSLDQLIEECRKLENKSPPPPLEQAVSTKMKIISDVVIEAAKIVKIEKKKNCDEHLKKFNHNVIGKKNLSLLKPSTSSSSSDSDSSDTDSDKSEEHSNNTVICKETKSDTVAINDIISSVEVKKILDEEVKKKNILSHLEEVRKRTIRKIKNPPEVAKKTARNNKKPTVKRIPKRKDVKKKESSVEESNTDEESQKLVKGLWQRGIHLVPKKTPKKKNVKLEEPAFIPPPPPLPPPPEDKQSDDSSVSFDTKVYEDFEVVAYEENGVTGKSLENYNFEVLKKGFEATVFAEHLQKEVTRTMRWTQFDSLADIPVKINVLTPRKSKRLDDEAENELMDDVCIGSVREESSETKPISRGGKKRKSRLSEDENKQVEKKSKNYDIKLLKKIDVDVFLDKVHGE